MLKRSPAWLKRPAAATFGFGGRLVTVLNEKRTLAGGEKVDAAHIEVKQVSCAACSRIRHIGSTAFLAGVSLLRGLHSRATAATPGTVVTVERGQDPPETWSSCGYEEFRQRAHGHSSAAAFRLM